MEPEEKMDPSFHTLAHQRIYLEIVDDLHASFEFFKKFIEHDALQVLVAADLFRL